MASQWIERDGARWIRLGDAARYGSTKKSEIERLIDLGLPSRMIDGAVFIRQADANRLKREAATMRKANRAGMKAAVDRTAGISDELNRRDQLVLPMSSGRRGRGWGGKLP